MKSFKEYYNERVILEAQRIENILYKGDIFKDSLKGNKDNINYKSLDSFINYCTASDNKSEDEKNQLKEKVEDILKDENISKVDPQKIKDLEDIIKILNSNSNSTAESSSKEKQSELKTDEKTKDVATDYQWLYDNFDKYSKYYYDIVKSGNTITRSSVKDFIDSSANNEGYKNLLLYFLLNEIVYNKASSIMKKDPLGSVEPIISINGEEYIVNINQNSAISISKVGKSNNDDGFKTFSSFLTNLHKIKIGKNKLSDLTAKYIEDKSKTIDLNNESGRQSVLKDITDKKVIVISSPNINSDEVRSDNKSSDESILKKDTESTEPEGTESSDKSASDIPPEETKKRFPEFHVSYKDDIDSTRDKIISYFGNGADEEGKVLNYFLKAVADKRAEYNETQKKSNKAKERADREITVEDDIPEEVKHIIYGNTILNEIRMDVSDDNKNVNRTWENCIENLKKMSQDYSGRALEIADDNKWDMIPEAEKRERCSQINRLGSEYKFKMLREYQKAAKKNNYGFFGSLRYDFRNWREKDTDRVEKKYRDSAEGRRDYTELQDVKKSLPKLTEIFDKLDENDKEVIAYCITNPENLYTRNKLSKKGKTLMDSSIEIFKKVSPEGFVIGGDSYIEKLFNEANKDKKIMEHVSEYCGRYNAGFKEDISKKMYEYMENVLKKEEELRKDAMSQRDSNFNIPEKKVANDNNGSNNGSNNSIKTEDLKDNILYKKYILFEEDNKNIEQDKKTNSGVSERVSKNSVIKILNPNLDSKSKNKHIENITNFVFKEYKDLSSNFNYYKDITISATNKFVSSNKKRLDALYSQYSKSELNKETKIINDFLFKEFNTIKEYLSGIIANNSIKKDSSIVTEAFDFRSIFKRKEQNPQGPQINQNPPKERVQTDDVKPKGIIASKNSADKELGAKNSYKEGTLSRTAKYNQSIYNLKNSSPVVKLINGNPNDMIKKLTEENTGIKALYDKNPKQFLIVFNNIYKNFINNTNYKSVYEYVYKALNVKNDQELDSLAPASAPASVVTSGAVGNAAIPDRLYKKIIRRKIAGIK